MQHDGVTGCTLQWVEDFLKDRTQQVLVEGKAGKEAHIVSGVPQGSVLRPVLFLAVINDLPGYTNNSTTRLFVDDCVLYKRIASHHDAKLLQEDLDALYDWEHTWHMKFHPSKYQVLCITKKRKPITSSYNIHSTILEEVTSAKYLGVHIDSNLNFNTHIDVIPKNPIPPVLFFSLTSADAVARSRRQHIRRT